MTSGIDIKKEEEEVETDTDEEDKKPFDIASSSGYRLNITSILSFAVVGENLKGCCSN